MSTHVYNLVVGVGFLVLVWLHAVYSQSCRRINSDLFRPCTNAGYTHTFPLPREVNETKLAAQFMRMRETFVNCSKATDVMSCSFFVPQCREGNSKPILPCRRVCGDFLTGCATQNDAFDFMAAMCRLLPDAKASSGECIEPRNYSPSPNVTVDILESPCSPLLIPMCRREGYTHTIINEKAQKRLYKILYMRNFTEKAANASHVEDPPFFLRLTRNITKCRSAMRKLMCVQMAPPCFHPEGKAFYVLCQRMCNRMWEDCPTAVKQVGRLQCEHLAVDGEDVGNGFCKQTKWPIHWSLLWLTGPKPTQASADGGSKAVKPGIIAASVIVPVALIALCIGVAFYWKKSSATRDGYTKQEEDVET